MDFMKALDQTVREIKREVNLKVLKVPEIEQKVLDATSDEPWGPHGSDLVDIARASQRYGECVLILSVLWHRLGDTGANWRHVYKALTVIEYLLANGTERAVTDIVDNSSQIAKLTSFKYLEPNGKDVGLNVRKKAETVLAIVDDREKLKELREKAAATRDKYSGLSSTEVTHKSSAASFGSGSYSSGSRYGSTRSSKEADTSRDSYRGKERSNSSKETISDFRSTRQTSRGNTSSSPKYKSAKGERQHRRNQDSSTSNQKPSATLSFKSGGPSSHKVDNEDDDDFNPRATSTSGTTYASSNHVDLFGMNDPVDTTTSTSRSLSNVGTASVPEVDLFANVDFQSANAKLESATVSHAQMSLQDNIDLFAGRSSFGGSVNSDTDFSEINPFQPSIVASFPSDIQSSVHDTPSKSGDPAHQHSSAEDFDPFAAIAARTSYRSNSFGAFSSNTGSGLPKLKHDPTGGVTSPDHCQLEELNFGAFTSHMESPTSSAVKPMNEAHTKRETASATKQDVKKGAFQVKSSIWADSLSRGLIDLNITAQKKVDHSEVGVVGQLTDGPEEKGPADPWYMGTTMGIESGLGTTGFPSSTGTTGGSGIFNQQQFGNFK